MPSVVCVECRKYAYYAECRNAECHYAECHSASVIILSVIMLRVIILSVIMLSVTMLNVVAPLQPTLIFQLKLLYSKGA